MVLARSDHPLQHPGLRLASGPKHDIWPGRHGIGAIAGLQEPVAAQIGIMSGTVNAHCDRNQHIVGEDQEALITLRVPGLLVHRALQEDRLPRDFISCVEDLWPLSP